ALPSSRLWWFSIADADEWHRESQPGANEGPDKQVGVASEVVAFLGSHPWVQYQARRIPVPCVANVEAFVGNVDQPCDWLGQMVICTCRPYLCFDSGVAAGTRSVPAEERAHDFQGLRQQEESAIPGFL